MKRQIVCIVLSFGIIMTMWYFSPKREYYMRPEVEIAGAVVKNIYDSVIVHGRVESGKIEKIRLPESAQIDEIYVSVGDEVLEDDMMFEVSKSEDIIPDTENVISEIEDIFADSTMNYDDFYETESVLSPEIVAPISGVVTDVFVKKGDVALAKTAVATICDFDNLEIRVDVPEMYISRIKLGQKAEISGDAFEGKKYIGKVKQISPTAKQKNTLTEKGETTVEVLLSIDSKKHVLRPGYSISAKIYTQNKNDAIVLPYSCIFQDESDREYVYVLRGDIVHKTAVRTGLELDDEVEILSGIKRGDIAVLNPGTSLLDKSAVKHREAK